ncbi:MULTISPECIES: DUF6364 family protein [Acinetobacter]|uniref:DUF6364 family protein n=1 Tax=Acinetobacter TaxID=469 RepID=UPI0002AE8343|nr:MULTISPECIES: DUF6364 family protein [Acinetobacter]ELW80276.1 toxin-antitoxin system, antitoxin component, ribbon-helix-helix domain protein [Acinetobacter sp. WC-743]MBJ8425015.1 antitoxin [Acinetobacter bereziniae]MBJ8476044.1 antitoxin [Acinetobacter bereziniae]
MQAKLTLSINKKVIERAKLYAQEHEQSVSSLVEAYLDRISAHIETSSNIQAPITGSLIGMFADQDQGQDYKTLLYEACMEKHK